MAAVVKSTKAGIDAISATKCIRIDELLTASGAAFDKYDAVYIDSDGKVRPVGIGDSALVHFDGFAMSDNDSTGGLPCTILGLGLIMEWLEDSDDYTPGQLLYASEVAHELSTVSLSSRAAIARAITNTEIIVVAAPR